MKYLTLIAMFVLMISTVSATGDVLAPKDVTMAYVDTLTAEYCVTGHSVNSIPLEILSVCKDVDGISGCMAADEADPAGLTVEFPGNVDSIVLSLTSDGLGEFEGCTDIDIETNLNPADGGLFYYTVGDGYIGLYGQKGSVVAETGSIFVPEFGIIAAGLVLGLAGLYIVKRRK